MYQLNTKSILQENRKIELVWLGLVWFGLVFGLGGLGGLAHQPL